MKDKFYVGMQYDTKHVFESDSIVECVRYAAAAAMHTGKSFAVHRYNERDGSPDQTVWSTPLVSVSANHFDYRQIKAESALVMKAFAHELVSNIEEIAPQIIKEGPLS